MGFQDRLQEERKPKRGQELKDMQDTCKKIIRLVEKKFREEGIEVKIGAELEWSVIPDNYFLNDMHDDNSDPLCLDISDPRNNENINKPINKAIKDGEEDLTEEFIHFFHK